MLRETFTVLNAYILKRGKYKISTLRIYITKLEKEEQSISKVSRSTAIKIIEKSIKLTTGNQ